MSRFGNALACSLLAVLVGALCMILTVESRRAREQGAEAAGRLDQAVRAIRDLGKRLDLSSVAWGAAMRSIRKGQEEIRAGLGKLKARPPAAGAEMAEPAPLDESSPASELAEAAVEPALPPVPDGVIPEEIFGEGLDMKALLSDTRINPKGKDLGRADRLRAEAEIIRAKSAMEVIEKEIQASVAQGMEDLRAQGAYVEYGHDEPVEVVDGVLSSGEEIPNQGARIFYFYRDEFPGIYSKRNERGQAAELGLRKILDLLKD